MGHTAQFVTRPQVLPLRPSTHPTGAKVGWHNVEFFLLLRWHASSAGDGLLRKNFVAHGLLHGIGPFPNAIASVESPLSPSLTRTFPV